jgi:GTPase SAR1 family protein
MLLANKCDLTRRQILEKEGKAVAEYNQIDFMECSAKENINIIESIEKLAKNVNLKIEKE